MMTNIEKAVITHESEGWTFTRASYLPIVPRIKLFVRLTHDTWRYRKRHGGILFVIWTNFRLATWLKP